MTVPNPSMQRTRLPVRLLRQRLLSLLDALPAAASGDVTSVHRARVASRRLREVLPVLAEVADSDALEGASKQVRRITRALGPIRELDVALGHLAEMGSRAGVSENAVAVVRAHLQDERQFHRQAMHLVITPAAVARLKSRLHDPPAPRRAAAHHDAELRSARRRSAQRALRLRAEVRRSGALYDSERLHAVRVATKKLRYALEVERELMKSRATVRINRLKDMQDALGEIHDYEILLARTREVQTAVAASNRPLSAELGMLVRSLEEACRDGHAGFLQGRDVLLELCNAIVTAARNRRPTFRM
jgi:CHAD domain-containing protein